MRLSSSRGRYNLVENMVENFVGGLAVHRSWRTAGQVLDKVLDKVRDKVLDKVHDMMPGRPSRTRITIGLLANQSLSAISFTNATVWPGATIWVVFSSSQNCTPTLNNTPSAGAVSSWSGSNVSIL